ncbi:ABC transporter ATP-binding protein [Anaeromicrobium sediminis]|uniref:ABC transporter ATP-binding protein n=1 Tax=Anaeromicrobium sediminis TaxID=1478221 RepID=UPI001FA81E44|nr:ABC transporter ATP-binding protein [Anaeromicrobium sediminis]
MVFINAIDIKNVRKVFRVGEEKVVALDDVSLEVKAGEVCCLLGTSGSGKSTLLNMMAGLEKPTKGIISIAGRRVDKMTEEQLAIFRQKEIGFVFQSYNLLTSLTALENVSLPLTFRGFSKKVREKHGKEILRAVGLEKYVTHKPTQMSGGQQQRVGIARAFVSKPPIVFADEPTGNLDSRTTEEVMNLILKIAKDNNQTLIIVTHDRSIAEYADKVVYILDGNIQKIETREERECTEE